jgi:ABC-type Na+ transport system ATPase subunit NatA
VCTRIVIINGGRKIIEGSAQEISQSTGTNTLEAAFSTLTGVRDATSLTADFLAALERT